MIRRAVAFDSQQIAAGLIGIDHGQIQVETGHTHLRVGLESGVLQRGCYLRLERRIVAAIRGALDEHSFEDTVILSYAAKYASAYYGPFRDAAESTPQFGDRRSYQMDPPNVREAMREMQLDLDEGADVLMVKPALPYLDVLSEARRRFDVPLAAYHVSGEYSMIQAAAERGWIDGPRAMQEALVSIKRAGADWILSYAAADLAERLSA